MAAIPSRFDLSPGLLQRRDETVSQLKLVMFDSTVVETARSAASGLPKPRPGFRRLEPTPELLDELREASQRLETATPEEIIAWGVEHYAPYLTMATAFGPEGCVILAMLAKIAPETYVFNLETGYQFPGNARPARPDRGEVRHRSRSAAAGAVGARSTKRCTAGRCIARIRTSAASIARSRRCSGRRR